MPDQFQFFELIILKKNDRLWRWCVCTTKGEILMQGSERNRPEAKYKAERALFLLLLCAPYYRTIRVSNPSDPSYNRSGRTRPAN